MFPARLILVQIFLLLYIPVISATTIHGTIYEWSTFKPLDNALIEINTTPLQFRVATSGIYSFYLKPGDDILEYYSEDVITITNEDGDYVFDILLFPIEEEKEEEILFEKDIANLSFDINEESTLPKFNWIYSTAAIIVLILAIVAAYHHYHNADIITQAHIEDTTALDQSLLKKDDNNEFTKETSMIHEDTHEHENALTFSYQKDAILPDDLKEIIEILRNSHGRITQKELRMKLKCSEAKVSLMITDLEARGLVQKIKKGRGNIIIFTAGRYYDADHLCTGYI
jgi:uncharacterized membrane protein